MQKAYARIHWENDPSTNTPLNETNLNKVDSGLDTVDDRIILFDTTKANQTDLLQSVKNITYNSTTGVFVFTWWNGTTLTADLNIEKIPVSFSMSPQGVITMKTADGTTYTCDVASLIKTYTFTSGDVILFTTVTDSSGNKTVTATIADGSVTEEMLEVDFLANCQLAQANAEAAADNSKDYSLISEGWAKGTQDDTDVTSGSPYYHNNSEYFKDQASASATAAASSETNAATSETNASNSALSASASANSASTSATNAATSETNASNSASSASTSATNAATSETNASNSASSASTSATNASASATLAESYAKGGTGTRQGENTDNAKYYKEVVEAAIGSGIATTEHVGLVKPDGDTIVIDSDGTIHGTETYVLPTATPTTLGGVKPDGTSILVSSDGTISTSSSAPEASDVEYDNTTSGLTADNVQDAIDELASEKQDAATAITTSNIGSQSVNYANSAGSATSATTATTATSATTATKATQDGNGNNIVNTYQTKSGAITTANIGSYAIPKSNGKVGEVLHFESSSLPEFSGEPGYLVGIDSFAGGGTLRWKGIDSIRVGKANNATNDAYGHTLLGMIDDGNYMGMTGKNGDAGAWVRTTSQGIIPYQSGGPGNGHSYIGTNSWYFAKGYFDRINDAVPITSANIGAQSVQNAVAANVLGYTGTGTSVLSAYQSSASYFNSEMTWASYIICNHGNGSNYFHQMIRLPFFNDFPQYQRLESGTLKGWVNFVMSGQVNNIIYTSALPASPDPNTIYLIP